MSLSTKKFKNGKNFIGTSLNPVMLVDLINDLTDINLKTCELIWSLPDVASKPAIKYPKLIIPYKRDMNRRISEQEARFVYCSVLNNSEFFYSIETPTEREYRLSGKGKRSASTDLSIYKYTNGFKKLVNVEFKAHNARFNEIEKDIKKLVHEGITGNWFHLLVNVNSRTLKALFGKIKRALIENYSEKISILFCFCVLSKRWACIKHFSWDSEKRTENYDIFIERFFEFDYEVKRKIKVIDGNEWLIYAGT